MYASIIFNINIFCSIGIFLKSEIGKRMNTGNFNIPPANALPSTDIILPNVILGDEAFALSTSMMKPFPRNQTVADTPKAIYNYRHSRARRTTENAFGIMCQKFRIFFQPINTKVTKIDKIVMSAVILHNLMREENITANISEQPIENISLPTHNLIPITHPSGGRPNIDGVAIRNAFKDYFNGVGQVAWQQNML